MHDIDRALYESENESEFGAGETGEAGEFGEYEQASGQELALAGELLEITSEAELDRFLGDLISGAVKAARGFASSDAGKAVGGMLKSAAKQALPQIGQLVGNAISPGSGGSFGRSAGQWLGNRLELGLETEGMSAEDREFEEARSFVRFAQETAQRAAQAAGQLPPAAAARQAALASAARHLPGLVSLNAGSAGTATSGRWVRRGGHIVILGA